MSYVRRDSDPYERDGLSSKTHSIIQSQEEPAPSDKQLIELAQGGNEAAFNLVYQRYHHQIYIFLTHMVGNSSIGEDLAQETFLKAWRAMKNLRETTKFLSWLYSIATHVVFDYFRRHEVPTIVLVNPTLEDREEVSIPGPEAQVLAEERLKEALAGVVPEKCRACLILYHIEEYSVTQIAEYLGIKPGSVRQYLSFGLHQLRSLLKEDSTSKEDR